LLLFRVVARALFFFFSYDVFNDVTRYSLAFLDYSIPEATSLASQACIPLKERLAERIPELLNDITAADIVLIHWWNHPLLYAFLVKTPMPPARILLWSHVSGHTPPQTFTRELLAFPDLFVIASPFSLESPIVRRLSPRERQDKIRLVFSCAGTDHVASARPVPHEGFRIGYVGTVDYCKMHRNYLRMSAAAEIPEARFVVCGGPRWETIQQEAHETGIGRKFEFLGHVNDVASVLSSFDVFGYPLAPTHYGTGEQTLIEAMAAGVPPVVIGNGAEHYIVENGVTGLVAEDEAAYTRSLELLYRRPDLRTAMAQNARKNAEMKFTIQKTAQAWRNLYDEVMPLAKRPRAWPRIPADHPLTPAEVFIASLGEHGRDYAASLKNRNGEKAFSADDRIALMPDLFRAETRGSVFHYQAYFPDDPYLNYWCGLTCLTENNFKKSKDYFHLAAAGVGRRRISRFIGSNPVSGRMVPPV
ncbi:MAG: glycosyltransferase family 4 protein, partial [Deltaproteobacteria bacterium]|nr:glycosyltransferase family 4 protein [Deltaproteobacteria bacterium]